MGKLEKLLPLEVAAERLGLSVETLTGLIDDGTINASITEKGEVLVTEKEIKRAVTREQFKHLEGKPITVTQAIEKYGLNSATWSRYIKAGRVKVLTPGYRAQLDEASVAYIAKLYKVLGGKSGSRIFAKDGHPYQLKYPDLARRRRKVGQEQVAA